MRTKTLVFSAVALAAGIFSAAAQSNVFSVNVVGYYNTVIPNSYVLLANQLDNGTNDLNSLLGSLPNKSLVQVWNGSSFTLSTKGGTPSVWSPDLSVPPGTGFFVKLNSGSITNTFVGNVVVGPGASVTNNLPASYVLVGSPIPYADDLNGTNINLSVLPNKSLIQIWNGSSYTLSTKGGTPSVWAPDATINVGQGFFVQAKSATSWVQTLPNQ